MLWATTTCMLTPIVDAASPRARRLAATRRSCVERTPRPPNSTGTGADSQPWSIRVVRWSRTYAPQRSCSPTVSANVSASSSPSDDEEAFLLAYSDLSTAFLAAAEKGYIHCMTTLIARGVDLNCKNSEGFGPLHLVARLDTQRDAGVLPPRRNADAAARASATPTPFADRFTNTWSEILSNLLLQAGADPNKRTTSGQTPLVVAVKDRAPVGLVRCLLDAGADPLLKFDGMAPVVCDKAFLSPCLVLGLHSQQIPFLNSQMLR